MLNSANPQATSGWICGILEGEGYFRIYKNSPEIRISNTDLDIISACEKYFKDNNIYAAIYNFQESNKKRKYDICMDL